MKKAVTSDRRKEIVQVRGEARGKDKWDGSGSPMVLARQGGSSSKLLDDEYWVQQIACPLKSAPQSKGLAPASFLKRGSH